MSLTIKDIAKQSGVSISTVSRVINGNKMVNSEMKEKVEKVLKQTGYRPNALAKGLVSSKTNCIGVLIPDLANINFAEFVKGVEQYVKEKNYTVLLGNSMNDVDREISYLNVFSENRVDGIIFSGTMFTEKHRLFVKQTNIPIIICGQRFEELDLPWINIDNEKAAYDATMKLIEMGHKQISFISGPIWDKSAGYDRYQGFLKALAEKGISPSGAVIAEGDFSLKSGYRCMEQILNKTHPTAVFAANDFMAVGAIKCLDDHHIDVPNQISVMGFDDDPFAEMHIPALSSIKVDFFNEGKIAAEILLREIDGEDVIKENVIGYKLVQRDSTVNVNCNYNL